MSLRGAQRRDNPFSSQHSITESSTLGEYEKMLRIRPRQHILAHAGTRQVSACHCEERSDVAIRSPCSTTSQKAVLWANTKKYYEFAQKRIYRCLSLRGCGLPHQCAHWFAMTCKRRVRVSECKAVLPSKPAGGCGFCHWADVLPNPDTQQISACHCEERSDVAIRSPCSTASQKAVLWANTKKCYEFAQAAYHKSPGNRGRRRTFPCAGLTFAGFSAIM